MANESYSEKIKRVRKEQKARFLKKQEENKKKSAEDDIVKVRAKKSKSSKLGSSASSSGSKNPASKFQSTKKTETKKTVDSSLLRALKNKGKANANEMKVAGPVKTTTAASTVKVKSGNTLSQIAKSKGITLKALLAANPSIKDANKIKVGQNINIPASAKGSVYKGMTKTEMAKMAMNKGGTSMKKKTKYMAKGGMKKTKYMAKGGAGMKKTKMYSRGGAAKKK